MRLIIDDEDKRKMGIERILTDSRLRIRTRQKQDHGFSLVELIVTVVIIGIIVAIAIPFFLNAQDSARQAAVDVAARDGQVMTRANILQGEPHGGDLTVLETDDVVLTLAGTFVIGDESTVCVRADWVGTDNYAISGPCDESDVSSPIFDRDPDDPLYTRLTYQCPRTKSGYLGIVNVSEDTRVQMWDNADREGTIREVFYDEPEAEFDLRFQSRQEILRTRLVEETGSVAEAYAQVDDYIADAASREIAEADVPEYSIDAVVDNASELVEMEGGVTYTVRFDGHVETFSAPGHRGYGNVEESLADCLVGINHFGESIDLKNIVYLGGENLIGVPTNLPESVRSLRAAFENATYFDDESISSWDVPNVHSMRSMFYNAPNFNQDIDGWEPDSLVYAENMFQWATDYNQDMNSWSMSNVVDTSRMFRDASSFNGNISGWDTSNVTTMHRMFDGATRFNQDLRSWNVGNVQDITGFARGSALEDDHLPQWEN